MMEKMLPEVERWKNAYYELDKKLNEAEAQRMKDRDAVIHVLERMKIQSTYQMDINGINQAIAEVKKVYGSR